MKSCRGPELGIERPKKLYNKVRGREDETWKKRLGGQVKKKKTGKKEAKLHQQLKMDAGRSSRSRAARDGKE